MDVRAELDAAIQRAIDRDHFGKPTARKGGRNPKWPYVPVVRRTTGGKGGGGYDQQLKGKASAPRPEAVDCARHKIELSYRALRSQLLKVGNRPLREQHGLPRELDL